MTTEPTIETYDRVAARYAERWQDRSVLETATERFCASLSAGDLVLDAGCGPGFDAAILRRHDLRVVGLDRSWGMLQVGREQFPGWFVQADMRHLPLRAGFRGVWANASLLHLHRADLVPALRGFRRLLLPDGMLFAAVKAGEGSEWQSSAYGSRAPRYFTYWRAEAFDAALGQAGFQIEQRWQDAGEDVTWLNRLARPS
ncbi:MAG TPA: class I SAM-dependent methyltransferase [Candidatus Sulfomarinibacteraceae bacterium]|nr:class I SAM-dependent methyltransferase [Candidatus Sulfomarinibacteraceae bacterium]